MVIVRALVNLTATQILVILTKLLESNRTQLSSMQFLLLLLLLLLFLIFKVEALVIVATDMIVVIVATDTIVVIVGVVNLDRSE